MTRCKRTSSEWFAEAARCYVEQHQGCAWCGGSYRVFHSSHGTQSEYYCNGCDFRVVYDSATGRFHSYPGEKQAGAKPLTMVEH
jgi:hypothetical protein